MHVNDKSQTFILFLACLILLSSCATLTRHPTANELQAYTAKDNKSIFSSYSPVFVIEHPRKRYNLIGTPGARITKDMKEDIFVDHERPTIYTGKRIFNTSKGEYTNLIYRIHFEKVPFGIVPFYLTAGRNVGLIVVVTLNNEGAPILYTTVHTCGCYLSFIPTSYMPEENFPENWGKGRQHVYFENLPGYLDYNEASHDRTKTMILIRDGSHRVKDLWLSDIDLLKSYNVVRTPMSPLQSLEKLPLPNKKTTSFYEPSGPRKGYVKESFKPLEMLTISWWAFDLRVGEDKKLGRDKEDGTVFYTSLKPWARDKSDMRDFAAFLEYWGWRL